MHPDWDCFSCRNKGLDPEMDPQMDDMKTEPQPQPQPQPQQMYPEPATAPVRWQLHQQLSIFSA
eukprot:COSAG05_NODE_2338_length_3213_cov_1.894990_1_plen_64_part_00